MMNITIPVLVDVLEAVRTVTEGILDLRIVVTNHLGNPNAEELSYTLDTNENYMNGEPYDLGLSISAWFIEHPDFPIADYVAPPPVPEPTDDEKLDRLFASVRLTAERGRQLLARMANDEK